MAGRVITRGFGAAVGVQYIPTRGFAAAAVADTPTAGARNVYFAGTRGAVGAAGRHAVGAETRPTVKAEG